MRGAVVKTKSPRLSSQSRAFVWEAIASDVFVGSQRLFQAGLRLAIALRHQVECNFGRLDDAGGLVYFLGAFGLQLPVGNAPCVARRSARRDTLRDSE
ncbi:hypothetical protein CUJ84_Chr002357 [Rhizobium leguminosarum]|uniref:Uncharacterized protein n=1 Tax=Rhizobium leguminosarum TaxID=384 RepID=A0A2K9Z3B0_RHILE|nr:hypothetical protein CUJ84_Chr002357 [Rhizobium leguminosarum]